MTDTPTDNTTATPTGEPDKRDRESWLLLALITASDFEAADLFWAAHVQPSRQAMLRLSAGWRWDAARQAFVSRTGQDVGGAALKRQATQLADEAEHDMRAEAQRVAVGELPIDEWEKRQAEDVKDLYLCCAALSAGGWRNLTPALQTLAEGSPGKPPGIAFSIGRLWDFAHGIASGDGQAGTEAMIARRAALYSAASSGVFENVRRESHRNARDEKGRRLYLYEKNILMPGENCIASDGTPGCIEETARGWVPLGTLSLPTTRTCAMNCNCSMDYALSPQ